MFLFIEMRNSDIWAEEAKKFSSLSHVNLCKAPKKYSLWALAGDFASRFYYFSSVCGRFLRFSCLCYDFFVCFRFISFIDKYLPFGAGLEMKVVNICVKDFMAIVPFYLWALIIADWQLHQLFVWVGYCPTQQSGIGAIYSYRSQSINKIQD